MDLVVYKNVKKIYPWPLGRDHRLRILHFFFIFCCVLVGGIHDQLMLVILVNSRCCQLALIKKTKFIPTSYNASCQEFMKHCCLVS